MHRPAARRLLAALTTVTVLVATTACGSPDESPAPTGPVTYDVPGAPVSITAPAGWERSTQDGAFVVRSPEAQGAPAVRPNVVVTAEATPETLEEAGADTEAYVEDLAGWAHDTDAQGVTTLGEAPAYRVSGRFEASGVSVAQEILLVGSAAADGPWVVHLTASYAPDDVEGAAQAREALASVRVAPAG
ncbi:hypothetical protein [Cellulosimicrobium sp. NPDC057127]|uniref:hypothetical protein n=1 Tax=Cellulosimicrobium sp. NPDC057127 TaxID=3346026 RepID=UPI00362BF742